MLLAAPAWAQSCPAEGSCVVVHPTPGCDDPNCCTTVCSIDPTCCSATWDSFCVLVADQQCIGYCGATASGSCFASHANPGCDNGACCATVCGLDPFCCTVQWDTGCAQFAGAFCDGSAGTCGDPAAGDCNAPHPGGACSDAICCNAVCAIDPTCCSSAWDAFCVIIAGDICVSGCTPVEDPGAVEEAEACAARSNDPCYRASGGVPETIVPGVQLIGTLGSSQGTGQAVDVDVYTVTLVDTDGDGFVSVALNFGSTERMWAALIPSGACTPVTNALLQATSELCVDDLTDPVCLAPGAYRIVVAGGNYPAFGGGSIGCVFGNTYALRVEVSQACSSPCASADLSCFAAHSEPGCNDPKCCSATCASDPFCCDASWDGDCVALAASLCLDGPAANDLCADAAPLVSGPQSFNTLLAGTEAAQHPKSCKGASFVRDVWFRWTADREGECDLRTCGSWFDTVLAVYEGPCEAPTLVACSDDGALCGGVNASRLTFLATCGMEYLVRVGSATATAGEASLFFAPAPTVCPDCPADLSGDGLVDAQDLATLLGAWGSATADLDGDGQTNAADLAAMLSAWGPCP